MAFHQRANSEAGQRREEQDYDQAAHEGHLHPGRDAAESAAGEQVDEHALQARHTQGDECAGTQHAGRVDRDQPPDHGCGRTFAAGDQGRQERAEQVGIHREQAQERHEGDSFAGEDGAAAERQRGENQVVLAVRKEGVPFEHHDEAHDDHGEHDEEVVIAEQEPVVSEGMVEAGALRNHVKGHKDAGRGHESDGLHDVGAHVAVLRHNLVIEEAPEEMAHQQFQAAHHASRMTETISRAEAPTSSCLASWRKICSSDGRSMRSRRRPTSSLATICPW